MAGRLISLLNPAFGSGLSLRQRCACVERGAIVTQRRLAVFLQIENSSQIDMRPGHHFRLLRDLESPHEPKVVALSYIYLGRIFDLQEDREAALGHYRAALNAGAALPEAKAAAERGIQQAYEPPSHPQ